MAETSEGLVRLAGFRDAETIARMSRELVEHGLVWRYRPYRIRQLLRDRDAVVIVACKSSAVSGFAIMRFAETSAHLNLLAVDQGRQRSGIASAMLAWLRASCQIAGIGRINLEVRRNNTQAIRFYEKHGFTRLGLHRGYYDGREDAVLMSCRLIPADLEEKRPG